MDSPNSASATTESANADLQRSAEVQRPPQGERQSEQQAGQKSVNSAEHRSDPVMQSAISEVLVRNLQSLCAGLDVNSLWWASGFLAGRASALEPARGSSEPAPKFTALGTAASTPVHPLAATSLIIYGTQSGNAKIVASKLHAALQDSGAASKLLRADQIEVKALKKETQLILVLSTQGEGDPSDDARGLFEDLLSARAPKLPQLNFAVFGLGDSSYAKFCEVGKRLDARLAELGAQRLAERVDADVEFDTAAKIWIEALQKSLRSLAPKTQGSDFPNRSTRDSQFPARSTRDSQFPARSTRDSSPAIAETLDQSSGANAHASASEVQVQVLENQRITSKKSEKNIRHIELDLSGSGLHYAPGDSLAVRPINPASAVRDVLTGLSLDGEQDVLFQDETLSLRAWLSTRFEITRITPGLVKFFAQSGQHAQLDAAVLAGAETMASLLSEHQLADLAQHFPIKIDAQTLLAQLRPIKAREYSIASAQAVVGDEVHLTVAQVSQQRSNRAGENVQRVGAASDYLSAAAVGDAVSVRVIENPRFRLPQDPQRDVIMVGPGTGVAPFRAFLQARAAEPAGRNWLLFGNPHFHSDFLYQLEWQRALQAGTLTRLDLAFSRDHLPGAKKRYVQHCLLEASASVYQWLQQGAHFYVCGDAKHMAKDVEQALLQILGCQGDLASTFDADLAAQTLRVLSAQGRYQRDVY